MNGIDVGSKRYRKQEAQLPVTCNCDFQAGYLSWSVPMSRKQRRGLLLTVAPQKTDHTLVTAHLTCPLTRPCRCPSRCSGRSRCGVRKTQWTLPALARGTISTHGSTPTPLLRCTADRLDHALEIPRAFTAASSARGYVEVLHSWTVACPVVSHMRDCAGRCMK